MKLEKREPFMQAERRELFLGILGRYEISLTPDSIWRQPSLGGLADLVERHVA